MINRYHIRYGGKRTTVSISALIANMLAVHLGVKPETGEAYKVIQQWCQDHVDSWGEPGRTQVSQWLTDSAIYVMARPELQKGYLAYLERVAE
jgi:phage host-nuclease inhibitor protein Gam